jgi:hypothetical protein
MRCRLTRLALALLVAAGLVELGGETAYADPVCQQTDRQTGECLVWVEVPASPGRPGNASPVNHGSRDTGSGASCYWDPSKQGLSGPPAGPVPCSKPGYGNWSNAYNCYISPMHPAPPAGDPSWQGHEPGDGAVYGCYQPQTDMLVPIWAANPPTSAAAGPSPREVAQMAIDQLNLTAINIGITPEPGPDSIGLVGMPVWLWAKDPDSHTFGPATASASAGGITVTATARVDQVTWDMGDGDTVTCTTAGTPYTAAYGNKRSPDCGHVYTTSSAAQPDQRYTVTATSDWVITWEGAGQTGIIRLNGLARSVQIAVGEAQVLVQ